MSHPIPAEDRFWHHVVQDGACWVWTGRREHGHGRFAVSSRRQVYAHRWAYEYLIGPIPDGLTLDHLCRNRPCVNPTHLEPVTLRENILRGVGPTAVASRRTVCVNGHPYTDDNTRRETRPGPKFGMRNCLTCLRDQSLRHRAWERAQKVVQP